MNILFGPNGVGADSSSAWVPFHSCVSSARAYSPVASAIVFPCSADRSLAAVPGTVAISPGSDLSEFSWAAPILLVLEFGRPDRFLGEHEFCSEIDP